MHAFHLEAAPVWLAEAKILHIFASAILVAHLRVPSPLLSALAAFCLLHTSFSARSVTLMGCHFLLGFAFVLGSMAQGPDEGYSRDQLQPLTKFRSHDCSTPRSI